jgi:hypothetical protein
VKKAEPFSYDEEEMLRQKGALGTDEPESFWIHCCFWLANASASAVEKSIVLYSLPNSQLFQRQTAKEKSSNLQVLLIRHIKVI